MTNGAYQPPVNLLLTRGDCRNQREWPNYLELGFGPEHVPDLIRMATDEELRWADSESAEVWAPVHAWRALGQLRAEAAVEPLIQLFGQADDDDDDWVSNDMPKVFGLIGPVSIPALAAYLSDETNGLWARVTAANCLQQIAADHPESRGECVAILARQLELFERQDETFNGMLISDLEELKAVEAAPVMERAFAAGRVDETIMGDWEDVQVDLGLKEADEGYKRKNPWIGSAPPLPPLDLEPAAFDAPHSLRPAHTASPKARAKAKSKRKHVKASRKKNRRR